MISEITRHKMSEAKKGKSTYWLIGKHHSNETKLKISLALRGEKGGNWQGGKTKEQRMRRSAIYREWKRMVLKKDNYICWLCNIRGGILIAHHIKKWSKYPELRYDINNGSAMHPECHRLLHTINRLYPELKEFE